MVPPPPAPRFPSGEYELDGLLGSGGMAVVYRARDVRRARTVAMKVLRPEVAHVVGAERFRREIAVVSGLSHPNILPLLDSGETSTEDGHPAPFYVMPLIEGDTLAQCIEREGRLSVSDAFRITREILDAVEYAHAHGVLHRDIKPGNVLLSATHAVVADFGLAHLIPSSDLAHDGSGRITVSGVAVGTPAYMSPEQALGDKHVDERTDLFALGCVLYEMLTGVTPFDAPTAQSIISRKMNGMFIPVSVMRPGAPAGIDELMRQALAPEPADRFANAAAFRRALEGLEHVSRSGPVPAVAANDSPAGKTARWAMLTAFALIVVALLWILKPPPPPVPPPPGTTAAQPVSGRESIAILPLELALPDSELAVVANGLSMDLIDELSRYPALMVISWNGVRGYAGTSITPDSVARHLKVTSVVTGDLRRVRDSVRIVVRLADGATNAQVGKVVATGALHDVLGMREQIIDSLTTYLRIAMGQRLVDHPARAASHPEAWSLVAAVRANMESELDVVASSWPAPRRARRFDEAEVMLNRAAELDRAWSTPYTVASRLLLTRADVEDIATFSTRPDTQGSASPTAAEEVDPDVYRRRSLRYAERALARDANDAEALYMRGRARLSVWEYASDKAADTLLSLAEADLRRAAAMRRDMARAWNSLSVLLELKGDAAGAADAAERALTADAFLEHPEQVVSRLTNVSLASGRIDASRTWCARGKQQYPDFPGFWGCELAILGWTGSTEAAVDSAWKLLDASEARDSLDQLSTGWGTWRLLVAAIAARAGLDDSARAIVARVRSTPASEAASLNYNYGEAHVRTILGESDEAIALLTRYLASNPSSRRAVRNSPWFAKLRTDARFVAITSIHQDDS